MNEYEKKCTSFEKKCRDELFQEWADRAANRPATIKEAFDYGFENGSRIYRTEVGLVQVKTEWVLVECIQSYRMRYMVEVPEGKSEYALDTVSMREAKEFSQEDIGETIVSHRVVTESEALKMCDEDNDYCKSWSEELKVKSFFTKEGDKPF